MCKSDNPSQLLKGSTSNASFSTAGWGRQSRAVFHRPLPFANLSRRPSFPNSPQGKTGKISALKAEPLQSTQIVVESVLSRHRIVPEFGNRISRTLKKREKIKAQTEALHNSVATSTLNHGDAVEASVLPIHITA